MTTGEMRRVKYLRMTKEIMWEVVPGTVLEDGERVLFNGEHSPRKVWVEDCLGHSIIVLKNALRAETKADRVDALLGGEW